MLSRKAAAARTRSLCAAPRTPHAPSRYSFLVKAQQQQQQQQQGCTGRPAAEAREPLSSRRALLGAAAIASLALVLPPQGQAAGKQVFLNVAIEGKPTGRIVVELFDDVKVGAARFRDLSVGRAGVGYRLSRIDGIYETHLRVEGVKQLSYSATGESPIAGGDSVAELEQEMEQPAHVHDDAALVSLIVKEATERPITEKLVARDGKLVTVQMQAGEAPNGTGFMITRGPAPDLDRTNLVVGRVVEGMDIVEQIAKLPFSKPRVEWYDGPFFEAGKAMGDKRAVVAEKGFNRPFKRVIITKAGLL